MPKLQILIAGAGAVGCHYGILLQQVGCDVHFLARGQHLHDMQQYGLSHISNSQQKTVSVHASDNYSVANTADVILLCSKMTTLTDMLQQLKPYTRTSTLLVSLQNGVQAPEIITQIIPDNAYVAGSAFIGVRIEKPTKVLHTAAGGLRLGLWQKGCGAKHIPKLATMIKKAAIPLQLADNRTAVEFILWRKMLWNCGFNAITALTRNYARQIALDEQYSRIVTALMHETMLEAQAQNIGLRPDDITKTIAHTANMDEVKTSMWQDASSNRPNEIDWLNGYISKQAEQRGQSAPANKSLHNLITIMSGNK
ncbi:MAG: ketopantoate reductase family protein [Mariprofundales bacterium]